MNNFSLNVKNRKVYFYALCIFLTALFVRLINLFFIESYENHSLMEDASIYWDGAHSWINTGFFSRTSNQVIIPETERLPAYFIFIIFIINIFGDNLIAVLLCQAFLDSLTCVLIFCLGCFITVKVGLLSGIFSLLCINFIIHSSLILTETFFLFFICCILISLSAFINKPNFISAMLIGLFCGFGIMTRSLVVFIPLGIAFILPIITYTKKKELIIGLSSGLTVIMISSIIISPILLRNWNQYNTINLTSQNGVFLLDWAVGTIKALDKGITFSDATMELDKKVNKKIISKSQIKNDLNPFQLSNVRVEVAINELKKMSVSSILKGWMHGATQNIFSPAILLDPRVRALNKASFYETAGKNIFEKAIKFIMMNDYKYILILTFGITFSLIFGLFQAAGLLLMFKENSTFCILIILFVFYFLFVSGPVGGPKYRIPIEPVLIILQSYGIIRVYNFLLNLKMTLSKKR